MAALFRYLVVSLAMLAVANCAPRVQTFGPDVGEAHLLADAVITRDGRRLPLSHWPVDGKARAVLVALHGFNDYRLSFDAAATWWAKRGIATYAYDQRGFGAASEPGIWGGKAAMAADARTVMRLVKEKHLGLPLYLLGNSMGGAVALLALADERAPKVDGIILSAPAVWGARAMNPFYRFGLWLWAHLTPDKIVTGRDLDRLASDNIPMLRALGRDPLVIKKTRVDAVYGLTQLMGAGLEAAIEVRPPIMVLYGARDEIIPPGPVAALARTLDASRRLAVYPNGWHMLLRDCQAEAVWRDVASWITAATVPLPSGAEVGDESAIRTTARGPVAEKCPSS